MTGYVVIFGGMILFATAIGLYDFFAERQNRRARRSGRSV